jgi:regulation of enolase protein 1 (concanavalin A-like superfamily)
MQSVNNTDFDVEAKFETGLSRKYQMQGIIVEEDANHYLRLEFQGDGVGTRIYTANMSTPKEVYTDIEIGLRTIAPLYMRVLRNGDRWILFYSFDGSSWTPYRTFPLSMVVNSVGVYAANAVGLTSPAFNGQIDYFFNRATPIQPEDAPGGGLYLPVIIR